MKVTQEKLDGSQIGLEIEIPPEKSKETYEKIIKEFTRSVDIQGFRKGKVPRPILLQRIGSKRIKSAALEDLINNGILEAIKQESLEVLGDSYKLRSKFEELIENYTPGETITFQASVDVTPEVTLGQYTDLSVKAEKIEYNPKSVDDLLDEHRSRLATLVPVEDRATQLGDMAIVDFIGRKPPTQEGEEGEELPNVKGENFEMELEEEKFIPGFVEGIIGMNLNESKDLSLQFPENYPQKELANQSVIFNITLKEIKEKELPELDDDFAAEISEFETFSEFRESLEKQYQDKAAKETQRNVHDAIAEELLNHTSIDLPETMIEEEIQNLLVQAMSQFQSYGVDISKIFTREMVSEMREKTRPEAIKNIQRVLIIAEIAKQESLKVEEDALNERINQVKESIQDQKDIDEEKLKKIVSEELYTEKVLTWLEDKTNVELLPKGSLQPPEEEADSNNQTPEDNIVENQNENV